MNIIKILNLNLWNYNNFKKRKPKIIKLIKKYNPDIITLQEVRDDLRFNSKGNNQAKQLNEILNYKFIEFMKTMDVNKINNTPQNPKCSEGLVILSKFPIIKTIKKRLKQHHDDKFTRGILYTKIKTKKIVDIIVVHYSPNDLFSKLHLEETLQFAKKNKIKPIIIGDFNIKYPKIVEKLVSDEYISSRRFKEYISYPSENYVLDYIIIPKKFKFKSFSCIGDTKMSDHKALFAKIRI